MPTNLAIDDRLIEQAQKIGRHKTKKDTVNAALARRRSSVRTRSAPLFRWNAWSPPSPEGDKHGSQRSTKMLCSLTIESG